MGGEILIIISRVIKIIRVANRIADGKFKLDGKEYQLAQVETIGIIIINHYDNHKNLTQEKIIIIMIHER